MDGNARRQLGPFTIDEMIELTASIIGDPGREAETIASARSIIAGRKKSAQQLRLKAVFASKGERESIAWNEFVVSTSEEKDCRIEPGLEGTPDYYACYLPLQRGRFVSGVYFNRRTLGQAARAHKDLALRPFLAAIAVHEAFHYFVDRLAMPRPADGDVACGCSPYCALEEAGANYVARESAKADAQALSTFDRLIFLPRAQGGLVGYGEYDELDGQIASLIPYLKKTAVRDCVRPAEYSVEATKLQVSPRFVGCMGSTLWEIAISNARKGELPFYLDLAD